MRKRARSLEQMGKVYIFLGARYDRMNDIDILFPERKSSPI